MNINTSVLAQLNVFTHFAKNRVEANDESAVAVLSQAPGNESSVQDILKSKSDKPFAFIRTSENKQINNSTRALFKSMIVDLFGGSEANIPQAVKKAMHMKRFDGSGRPLTARRISAVVAAVVKAIQAKSAEGIFDEHGNKLDTANLKCIIDGSRNISPANNNVLEKLNTAGEHDLPDFIREVLAEQIGTINERCGEGTVKDAAGALKFISKYPLMEELKRLAIGMARDLNADDVRKAIGKVYDKGGGFEVAKLLERVDAIQKELPGSTGGRYMVTQLFNAIPDLKDALRQCRTPDQYKSTLDGYDLKIRKSMEISVALNKLDGKAVDSLKGKFREMTGIDPETLCQKLGTRTFVLNDVAKFKDKINSGEIKAKDAADVEKAFNKFVEKYVQDRIDLAEQAKQQLTGVVPSWALDHICKCALVVTNVDHFNLKVAGHAKNLDLASFKTELVKTPVDKFEMGAAMIRIFSEIAEAGKEILGVKAWAATGADEQVTFASLMLKIALANDMDLVKAMCKQGDEIYKAVQDIFDSLPTGDGLLKLECMNSALLSVARDFSAIVK